MNDMVQAVRQRVPEECRARSYAKDGCSVRLDCLPADHVMVDLDCAALALPAEAKRCDLVFIGEYRGGCWVAPIELKSGAFSTSGVAEQLQAGANLANQWLPRRANPEFAPVLAHRRIARKHQRNELRALTFTLGERVRRLRLIRCGASLREALASHTPRSKRQPRGRRGTR